MKTILLAGLLSALIATSADAQLIVSESGFLSPTDIYRYDLNTTGVTTIPDGQGRFQDVTVDEAGEVLYLQREGPSGPELWRWPFDDALPTFVGEFDQTFGIAAEGIAFGNGKIYVSMFGLCRSLIYECDPATPGTFTLVSDPLGQRYNHAGIAFDAANNRLLVPRSTDLCGGVTEPFGIYAVDPVTGVHTFLSAYAPGSDLGRCTVGDGKLWIATQTTQEFLSLDLTTLVWDPAPPANPIVPGAFGTLGIAWSDGFGGGATTELGAVYCNSNPNSSGNTATLSSSGSDVVADNDLNFLMTDGPANRFGYYLMSDTQGFIPLFAGSQGNFCLGSPFVRFSAFGQNTTGAGEFPFSPDLTNLPNMAVILPSETWSFQVWFRDVGGTSNTSNGYEILFQ